MALKVNIQNPENKIEIQQASVDIHIANQPAMAIDIGQKKIEVNIQKPQINVKIGCGCSGNGGDGGGPAAWGDITGNLPDQTDLQAALDGKSNTGHTHPLSDLTQSGATVGQIARWDGAAWVPDDEAGGGPGGASYTEVTYSEMEALIAANGLTPGGWYLITDASGTDLGFLTNAVTENEINVSGVGGYLNADFQAVGDYSGTPETFVAQQGIWNSDNEAGYTQGDVTIWNLSHYQLTDSGAIDGTDPATNTAAYTLLDKATYPETYVTAWDVSEFDFPNNWIQYRQDKRGNIVYASKSAVDNIGLTGSPIDGFMWGYDFTFGNFVNNAYIDIRNLSGGCSMSVFYPGAQIYDVTFGVNPYIYAITMFGGAYISGGSIMSDAYLEGVEMKNNSYILDCVLSSGVGLTYCSFGIGAGMSDCSLMPGASFSNIVFERQSVLAGKTIDGVSFSDKLIRLTAGVVETIDANVDGSVSQPGFSDIPGTIDISGLNVLDCTAAWAQYRGIYNLASDNATEAIDTITNPPTLFPFTLRPAAGLTLTITGTAYSGVAAGQIALKAASYDLDGDKGEYIVLEIDPLGTGALIEKQVVNGIL